MGPSGSSSPMVKRSSLEETIGRYLEESSKRQDNFEEWMKRFRESTDRNLKRHDSSIKGLEKKVEQLAQAVHSSMTHDLKSVNEVKIVATKRNFRENKTRKDVPRRLEKVLVNTALIDTIRQTPDYTKSLQELVSKKTRIEEVSMVKLNTQCLIVLQNEISAKEKDPGSFILPCIIGNMTVRIDKFIFLVDFVILDIVEDDNVPIKLGRPMLATAHAKIDVFGKKISLEFRGEKVMFNANEGVLPLPVSFIKGYLGDFLELDDLFPINDVEPFGILSNSNSEMGIRLEDFSVNLEDLMDEQAPQFGRIKVTTTTGTTNDIASAHG
ncbi:hypothetical protein Tco_0679508 [Tanacetum coccineum]|uniref:Uncharacterized protein n=1 Tax=Tanacetum coccineum TaxID=301880 RepID=A0ABQ4XI23_9ASTR